ncbi:hypothetical protein AZSI13_16530 [Azospira sp. I13]|uniref:alpha-glutamyl/putrescinyl thymine pyrophosphorylase clade 3 protein n=1 Tax=Azospira sp. I13 TaxID=1765050 RepID=UPI000D4EBBBB|nr:hypothetical protein [Azospira sp. I13]GBG02326.1 hypothetical protein AZSI13_16530 [Azospira sp. I13]
MKPQDVALGRKLKLTLLDFTDNVRQLPGIRPRENLDALVEQLIESIRRIRYIATIRRQRLGEVRMDPSSDAFDPLRAAVLHQASGNSEEACWLVFLATHFGKHHRTGWRLLQQVYGRLGGEPHWGWAKVCESPEEFAMWLAASYGALTSPARAGHFGNHRKYETLRDTTQGTGAVVRSYVRWINNYGSHAALLTEARHHAGNDRREIFKYLYRTMDVHRFGRTAKFDYLTMLGKLDLFPIEPNSAYLVGATGPLRGARLLFGGTTLAKGLSPKTLDSWLLELDGRLNVGMQVLEDSLCNWQKSPGRFRPFRG